MPRNLRISSLIILAMLIVLVYLGYYMPLFQSKTTHCAQLVLPEKMQESQPPASSSIQQALNNSPTTISLPAKPKNVPALKATTNEMRQGANMISPLRPLWAIAAAEQKDKKEEHGEHEERDNPSKLNEILQRVKTGAGEAAPSYPANYQRIELDKALRNHTELRSSNITYTERGPANVPGRTRALWVDPKNSDSIWIAASAGGGIWRTVNGGRTWNNQTPDLSNLTICALAAAPSNPKILYAGTGETVFSAQAEGDGILKSTDGGLTWAFLPTTLDHPTLQNVTKIIVNPDNPNHLVVAGNPDKQASIQSGETANVMISKDGGRSWSPSTLGLSVDQTIDQIIAAPDDFSRMYITVKKHGIYRSLDAGESWTWITPKGLPTSIDRIELAIAPQNSAVIYASIDGKLGGLYDFSSFGILLKSEDAGDSWSFLLQEAGSKPVDFLDQGFWNKTLMVSPFADSILYFGGVNLWKITTQNRDTSVILQDLYFKTTSTDYKSPDLFLDIYPKSDSLVEKLEIEFKFGNGESQKAHLFVFQEQSLPAFLKMVDVPWQVYDKKTGSQLSMVLISDSTGTVNQFSQILLTNLEYSVNPIEDLISDPQNFIEEIVYQLYFSFGIPGTIGASTFIDSTVTEPTSFFIENFASRAYVQRTDYLVDSYGAAPEPDFKKNSWAPLQGGVHPDQHALLAIVDSSQQKFKLLLGNDGGIFVSNLAEDPGINDGDFSWRGYTYNTAQFYGADKRKNADHYLGGTQDNGAWVFTGGMNNDIDVKADAKTDFWPLPSGDGFEVVWNKERSNAIIWSSQYNAFNKLDDLSSNNQAQPANAGLRDTGPYISPFISRIANTDTDPEALYAVGVNGVWVSSDFGSSWSNPSQIELSVFGMPDVDVSRANPSIIWAADGLGEGIHVYLSTDGANSFQAISTDQNIGLSTSITADLVDPNTAYLTFGAANRPKLLRTRDRGQSWQDLSGFDPQSNSRGFPNVAAFCMVAMPYDPKIIWVGTEIGVFATEDDGATWNIIPELPKSPIFNLKIVDDQVIVSTWGRGIWTASIPELATVPTPQVVLSPLVVASQPLLRYDQAITQVDLNLRHDYDSTLVLLNGDRYTIIKGNEQALLLNYQLRQNTDTALIAQVQLIGYKNGQAIPGLAKPLVFIPFQYPRRQFATDFERIGPTTLYNAGLSVQEFPGFTGQSLQSAHPYPQASDLGENELNFQSMLTIPVVVTSNGQLSYRDVALLEPSDSNAIFPSPEFYDYVIVEASKNLHDWIPLAPGYDARYSDQWLHAFNDSGLPDSTFFVEHKLSFFPHFRVGDTLVLRFRLYSDFEANGWGWLLDDLKIQMDELTSVQSTQALKVKLYPNPVQDQLQLELPEASDLPYKIRIIDVKGQVLKQISKWQSGTSIDVHDLPIGAFVLEIIGNSRFGAIRFVKAP